MIRAAGVLFITPANEALFLKRGNGGDYPGFWSWPGGQLEPGETSEQAAERECAEELGFLPDGVKKIWTRRVAGRDAHVYSEAGLPAQPHPQVGASLPGEPGPNEEVDFTTFLQRVPERFEPKLNDEHTGYAWARVDTPPEPLHPGARIALARLTMDELGIARAMAAGDLTSPQKYQNVWLFAIRITGTGAAYRSGLKEYVWRDPAIYLNDEFLARCNGLAVIVEHPKGARLNSQEFSDRVIGSIMLPYIQGDEVWGIAKVYDATAAHLMATEQLSTSPAVVLGGVDDTKIKLEGGAALLIEGEPLLLDHIAIVPNGVWDKGGDPTGVLTQTIGDQQVADETEAERKAREDKAKADADATSVDKLLTHIDAAIGKHMKPIADRMDAIEMADKTRRDAEEQSRRDAERAEWMKADAEGCARDDAEEEAERKAMEEKGEPKEVAADKARGARKDRMKTRRDAAEGERERREREDRARRDADEVARKDAEAKEAKERADAVAASTRTFAERIASLPKSQTDADYAAMADEQARADAVYSVLGERAPGPLQGEAGPAYRVRLARGLQRHSEAWSRVDLHKLETQALDIAVGQIYADAQVAANSPDNLPADTLVARTYTDAVTGHRITEFRGRHTFISQLKLPSMRATGAFLTGKGH